MRKRCVFFLLLTFLGVFPQTGLAQTTLTIDTVAGGGRVTNGDGGPALGALLQQANGLAADGNGNLYIAETAANRVRRVDRRGVISTFAGTGVAGFGGDGGPAASAQLNSPYGIASDGRGNLYIADLGNACVRRVAIDGTITTIAGGGNLAPGGKNEGAAGTSIKLAAPRNVVAEDNGILYISDFTGHRVFRLALDGTLTTIAGTGIAGSGGEGNAAVKAQLAYPAGLALDSQNGLYIADSQNHSIRKVANGVLVTLLQGTTPTGVALDLTGGVWVADAGAGTLVQNPPGGVSKTYPLATSAVVRGADFNMYATSDSGSSVTRIPQAGAVSLFAGGGTLPGSGGNGDGGPATAAILNHPADVTVDAAGNLWIADRDDNVIRKSTADGVMSSLSVTGLSQPSGVSSGAGGILYIADTGNHRELIVNSAGQARALASAPALTSPVSAVADSSGNVYVGDIDAGAIYKIDGAGNVTPVRNGLARPHGLALLSTSLYFTEETGPRVSQLNLATGSITRLAEGTWKLPRGIAVGSDGTIFVADSGLQQVLQVNPEGSVTALAGAGTAGFAGDGGPAAAAQLSSPSGVALNALGDLFIADLANNRIRRVQGAFAPGNSSVSGGAGGGLNTTLQVLNGASLVSGTIAPGMLLTLRGTGIPATGQAQTTIFLNSIPVNLVSMSDTEIRVQAPLELAAVDQLQVSVFYQGTLAASASVTGAAASPGLFDSINTPANPATPGSVITLYGTGLGLGDLPVTISVGGMAARIVSLNPAAGYPGLFQINAQVPEGASTGLAGVTLAVGGAVSPAGVMVSIQ